MVKNILYNFQNVLYRKASLVLLLFVFVVAHFLVLFIHFLFLFFTFFRTSSSQSSADCAPVANSKVSSADQRPRSAKAKAKIASSGKLHVETKCAKLHKKDSTEPKQDAQQHASSLTLIGGVALVGLLLWTGLMAIMRGFS